MFYAKFHPRGFSNEFDYFAFRKKADRDRFVLNVPRTEYSAYYQALVPTDNASARAYTVSAREVAADTASDRRSGYNRVGKWFRSSLTLAEYFGDSVVEAVDERGHFDSSAL